VPEQSATGLAVPPVPVTGSLRVIPPRQRKPPPPEKGTAGSCGPATL